jgi:NADH:ubiquinone reductase (H+-translocating)
MRFRRTIGPIAAGCGTGAVAAGLVTRTRRRRARARELRERNLPHVVIVGAGFGGLTAAKELRDAPVRVTVVDRRNHHLFQPLLYQVATAALNPADISAPIRHVLRGQLNVDVLLGDVSAVVPERRAVRLADGDELRYDFLVVATGATHSYYGRDEWAPVAPGLKTVEDALEIRRRVLVAFERAEREADEEARRALLTFVVVGAGPTGVELAGALAEIARHTLTADFRHIDPESARVILVEALPSVLPPYPPRLQDAARRQLEGLGVEVRTGAKVTRIDDQGVTVGDERIAARTVLWGAGVAASPLAATIGATRDRAGRVEVLPDLTVPGHPEIAVIGDLALARGPDGKPVPGVAPAAIQEGEHAARNVVRMLRGEPRLAFRYRDKGSLATIGRAAGVAHIGRLQFSGFPAWLAWLLVHVFFLIGFRNRVAVILQWAWSYFTFSRGARLITDTAEQWRYIADRRAPPPPETTPARPAVIEGARP